MSLKFYEDQLRGAIRFLSSTSSSWTRIHGCPAPVRFVPAASPTVRHQGNRKCRQQPGAGSTVSSRHVRTGILEPERTIHQPFGMACSTRQCGRHGRMARRLRSRPHPDRTTAKRSGIAGVSARMAGSLGVASLRILRALVEDRLLGEPNCQAHPDLCIMTGFPLFSRIRPRERTYGSCEFRGCFSGRKVARMPD